MKPMDARGQNEPVDRTDDDRDFAAITDDEIWAEARDRLKIATDAYSENRKRAKAAMLFREGDQWDHDIITTASEDNPELTINLTDAYVRRVVNNIKQQRPRGKCHPVGAGADIEIADVINGIGRHVEVRSEASVAYDLAAEQAIVGGEGYFRIIAEYVDNKSFSKDLRILPIRNMFTVFMDPSSVMPSGIDQTWCIISTKIKRQEYKLHYPNAANVNWYDEGRDISRLDWENKEEVRLAEYFRIREISEKLYLLRGPNGEEFTRFESEMPRNEETKRFSLSHATEWLAARRIQIVNSRDSSKRQVEWFRLNGLTVIERQIIPGEYIPVFRVEGNTVDIDGKIRRRGMVEAMMDPQRMVNYGEVAKIKRLGLSPKAPWVAAEGQLDGHPEWEDANLKPYPALVYKPVTVNTGMGDVLLPPPERQMPPQIEAGFSEFVAGMRSNLMAVSGMPNEPGQDQEGIVVSGKAISKRQWLSDQSHFQYYENLTQAIAQCWRVMVSWIPIYFSDERMQRIIGEDTTPTMVRINAKDDGTDRVKNDLSIGKYDIVIDTGPGYETKREEGAENLLAMLSNPALAEIVAKTAPDLVFRSIDHPYMQELADRLMVTNDAGLEKVMEGLSDRAKNVIQSFVKNNQALQQQIQQMQMEIKAGTAKAMIDAHTKTFDTQVKAHTALAVEEIRAGGKLLDSKTAHDAEAAMLERQMLNDAIVAGQQNQQANQPK